MLDRFAAFSAILLTSREENAVLVDADRIDDGVMSTEIVHESTVRASPLLDVVATRRGRSERVLCRMNGDRPDRLVVMCKRCHRFACSQVPQST